MDSFTEDLTNGADSSVLLRRSKGYTQADCQDMAENERPEDFGGVFIIRSRCPVGSIFLDPELDPNKWIEKASALRTEFIIQITGKIKSSYIKKSTCIVIIENYQRDFRTKFTSKDY